MCLGTLLSRAPPILYRHICLRFKTTHREDMIIYVHNFLDVSFRNIQWLNLRSSSNTWSELQVSLIVPTREAFKKFWILRIDNRIWSRLNFEAIYAQINAWSLILPSIWEYLLFPCSWFISLETGRCLQIILIFFWSIFWICNCLLRFK